MSCYQTHYIKRTVKQEVKHIAIVTDHFCHFLQISLKHLLETTDAVIQWRRNLLFNTEDSLNNNRKEWEFLSLWKVVAQVVAVIRTIGLWPSHPTLLCVSCLYISHLNFFNLTGRVAGFASNFPSESLRVPSFSSAPTTRPSFSPQAAHICFLLGWGLVTDLMNLSGCNSYESPLWS